MIEKNGERALAWLEAIEPDPSTEALLFRLLVERRIGDPGRAAEYPQELLDRQRQGEGWRYRAEGEAGDAFATGQALYALTDEGLDGDDPAVWRRMAFLLGTQR